MSKLTLKELELLNTASAYNGEQHKAICGKATLELIEYKQIEEELGIDLTIYFGALKNGVYYYSNSQLTKDVVYPISNFLTDYNDKLSYSFMTKFEHKLLSFDDYGKTWALSKEELE